MAGSVEIGANVKRAGGATCRNALLIRHQPFRRNVRISFQRHTAAHMEKQTGKTLQEAARTRGTAKLQFRWLDAPRSIGTARSTQVPGSELLKHDGMGGNEVLQQVLQRAILAEQKASLLEASLKEMTAQRDKWVRRNARFLRELATRLERYVERDSAGANPTLPV